MKKEVKIIILLLVLAPAIGELLSGSAPPLEFFNPLMFLMLAMMYGAGALLIREARVRWKLQWSVILIVIAYGILEEGLVAKSFFNTNWVDMGVLSGYGMYFGVQLVWTLMLIAYHATISTLVPITIVDLLWPEYKNKPLLRKRGLVLSFVALILITLYGLFFIGSLENGVMVPYYLNPVLLVLTLVAVLLLVWLAHKYKGSRFVSKSRVYSPFVFGLFGFLFQALNSLTPNFLPYVGVSGLAAVFVQLVLFFFAMLFVLRQVCNRNITTRHVVSLVFGSLLFWILLSPIYEFAVGMFGMFVVGIVAFVLLLLWRRKVLQK